MKSGFRTRLILTIIGLVTITAVVVAGSSLVLMERSLRNRLVEDAVDSAQFNLGTLLPAAGLPDQIDRQTLNRSELVERFLRRGTDGVWVEFDGADPYVTELALLAGPAAVSAEMRRIVSNGEVGYEFTTIGDSPVLVVGAQRPLAGPDFYFVTSTQPIEDAVNRMLVIVGIVGIVVIVGGALVARRVAATVLRPVAAAAAAAHSVTRGDLNVRIDEPVDDEFGQLMASFNEMVDSLRSTISDLEDARHREQQFVADVSHELRTPLTTLVNAVGILGDRLRVGENVTAEDMDILGLLHHDVHRFRLLVDDLLEISRLELSPEVTRTEVDLEAFLRALVSERHLGATLDAVGVGFVSTDPRAIERIVGNLLDNAVHHAPGSDVDVIARRRDGAVTVEIADRGPGVRPGEVDRIFDRFSMGDGSRHGGGGLGLAIARAHARRLGGDLMAQPREGGGLSMILRLPDWI